jgi:Mn2+/Fe2+ NRAMP family transporter
VEEELARGRHSVVERIGATQEEIARGRLDVLSGAFFSRVIVFAITLTTAATLHANGKTGIATAKEAAEALRPIAGDFAYLLFAVGFLGTGLLAIPVLAGASAYAVAEGSGWHGSLEEQPHRARRFYAIVLFSMLLGLCLKMAGFPAVAMLFGSAVLNGAITPVLILLTVLLASRRELMDLHTAGPLLKFFGWAAFALTASAAVAMLATLL